MNAAPRPARAPKPAQAAALAAASTAVLLSLAVALSVGIGLLATATGLPWLPPVALIVGLSAASGALRYCTEKMRARRTAEAEAKKATP